MAAKKRRKKASKTAAAKPVVHHKKTRRKKVAKKSGYSLEQIKTAVKGTLNDAIHQLDNIKSQVK